APFTSHPKGPTPLKSAPKAVRQKLINDSASSFARCKLWNVDKSDRRVRQAVRSSSPTRTMNGEHDPITPPARRQIAGRSASTTHLFIYPGVGHSSIGTSDCADRMVMAFLDTPTRRPDDSCSRDLTAPAFVTN